MIAQSALEEARDHLAVALRHAIRIDDPIALEHIQKAHALLQIVTRAQRAMSQVSS